VAAEGGKIDPMHQFTVEPLVSLNVGGFDLSFTNSALFMLVAFGVIWLFMMGGMKRELVPGRWQVAVESVTGFIDNMMMQNIGTEGRRYVPYVFSLFMFIMAVNFLGMTPIGIVPGVHPFTATSHITVTAVLAVMSFSIVLAVGFWRHGFHFFSLFVPSGTPWWLVPALFVVELFSFMVRPFSLALRLFIAMTVGHILMKVLAGFVINGLNAEAIWIAPLVSLPSFLMMIAITMLELLVCAIQAYVFALLTSLYLNDAVNLH